MQNWIQINDTLEAIDTGGGVLVRTISEIEAKIRLRNGNISKITVSTAVDMKFLENHHIVEGNGGDEDWRIEKIPSLLLTPDGVKELDALLELDESLEKDEQCQEISQK